MSRSFKVGFIGMGKLGLPVSIALDMKGHDVLGYDVRPDVGAKTSLAELMKDTIETGPDAKESIKPLLAGSKVRFADSLADVVRHAEVTFVAVQTPHNPLYEGITRIPETRVDFNYDWLISCMKSLSKEVEKAGKENFVVTIISTVLPTTLRRHIFPILSRRIRLCYNPFFIAMGTVMRDFLDPEFILLGAIDDDAGKAMNELYATICDAPVYTTTLENAELIKVAYNTFIGMKIGYANVIMEVCDKLPNTNCDEVMGGIRLAHRRLISGAYLSGGMGDGGGCHPRDNIALSWLSRTLGLSFDFFDAMMICREKQTEFLTAICRDHHAQTGLPIVLLGKAFKPETNMTTGSPAVLMQNILQEKGITAKMYDPYTDGEEMKEEILKEPAIFFISCKHDCFKDYKFPPGSHVIDPHRYIPNPKGLDLSEEMSPAGKFGAEMDPQAVKVFHVGGVCKASTGVPNMNDSWSC